jgi:hypothetical protein
MSLLGRKERFCFAAVLRVPLGGTKRNGAAAHAWPDLSHRLDRRDSVHPFAVGPAVAGR